MEEFKVPTYDQHLFLNEKSLEGNETTLSELNIIPNSLICLKVMKWVIVIELKN